MSPTVNMTTGQAFSGVITATGATLAQSPNDNLWELASGAIPDGLDFTDGIFTGLPFFSQSPSITLTGTPTVANTFNFSVRCTTPTGDTQTKAYSADVAAGIHVDRYWTMEETGESNRVDKVVGDILTAQLQSIDLDSAPGLYGNALHLDNLNPVGFGLKVCKLAVNRTVYNALVSAGTGCSMAGWIKVNSYSNVAFPQSDITFELADGSENTGILVGIQWVGGHIAPTPVVANAFAVDSHGTSVDSDFTAFATGAWIFWHIFYDGSHAGYSFNNGSETLFGSGLVCGPTALYHLEFHNQGFNGGLHDFLIDEVALKATGKFTADELAYLYNSGAGRTWPL